MMDRHPFVNLTRGFEEYSLATNGDLAAADNPVSQVFVYGTLKRGEIRGNLWPVPPQSVQSAWTKGTLYAGPDYPAMVSGDDWVLGEAWSFASEEIEDVLRVLDEIEGTNQPNVPDLYRRVTAAVYRPDGTGLGDAFAYLYATDPEKHGFHRVNPGAGKWVAWPT